MWEAEEGAYRQIVRHTYRITVESLRSKSPRHSCANSSLRRVRGCGGGSQVGARFCQIELAQDMPRTPAYTGSTFAADQWPPVVREFVSAAGGCSSLSRLPIAMHAMQSATRMRSASNVALDLCVSSHAAAPCVADEGVWWCMCRYSTARCCHMHRGAYMRAWLTVWAFAPIRSAFRRGLRQGTAERNDNEKN